MSTIVKKWVLAAAGVALIAGALLLWSSWGGANDASPPQPSPRATAEAAELPDFGPDVHVFDEDDDPALISATLRSLADSLTADEFTDERAAVLFRPGRYEVDAPVGFYTTISGTGRMPSEVEIEGQLHVEGRVWDPAQPTSDDALTNFWRGVENLSLTPSGGTARWAVSQAAPMRRVHIHGDLALFPQYGGPSSGGFLADAVVDGVVSSGSQQQWYTRDSTIGGWSGGVWNQAFTGVEGAPATGFPETPYTTLETTERSGGKPYLFEEDDRWFVFAPAVRTDARGASWQAGPEAGEAIPIEDFLIAKPSTTIAEINTALRDGRHLLLTPGVYEYDAPIEVVRAGTVVLGMGMATLVPTSGDAALTVADVDGVRLAGFTADAGPEPSAALIRVGAAGADADHTADPTSIHDVYVRVGGARAGSAETSVEVNSDDVLIDHVWLWRADHGEGVSWTGNRAAHGLVVTGDDVSAYGLFVEHYQENQVIWAGERGTTFFYQSELPYDPPSQSAWMDGAREGYASYRVVDGVEDHRASAMGVYSNFTSASDVYAAAAIGAPRAPGIVFRSLTSVFLAGHGGIRHVIEDEGDAVAGSFGVSRVPMFPGQNSARSSTSTQR